MTPDPQHRVIGFQAGLALTFLLALTPVARAEGKPVVSVGDRVRIVGRLPVSGPITGTLRRIERESITVLSEGATASERDFVIQNVRVIEISIGLRSRARQGLVVGLLVGAALISSYYLTLGNDDQRPGAWVPFVALGTLGTLGYGVGDAFRTETWRVASLPQQP